MALLRSVFGASSKSSVDKTNKWEDELRERYDNVVNREKFKYDMNNDPLHNQYAQLYEQNAKLAMQDTVGQVSALTGGYGNSYAQTAGQAMYNQQMSGMNDKALELYQMALNQYNAEGDRLMQMYGITADQYQTEYNRIRDEVADEQWQKSFDESQRQYNLGLLMDAGQFAVGTAVDVGKFGANMAFDVSRAAVSDSQWRESMDYQKERDAVADSQWQQSFDYKAGRDAVSDSQFAQELAYKYAALKEKDKDDDKDDEGDSDAYTYEGVVSFLKDVYGVNASGIMTESEFKSRKRRGAMSEYDSYASYAEAMINKYKNK